MTEMNLESAVRNLEYFQFKVALHRNDEHPEQAIVIAYKGKTLQYDRSLSSSHNPAHFCMNEYRQIFNSGKFDTSKLYAINALDWYRQKRNEYREKSQFIQMQIEHANQYDH